MLRDVAIRNTVYRDGTEGVKKGTIQGIPRRGAGQRGGKRSRGVPTFVDQNEPSRTAKVIFKRLSSLSGRNLLVVFESSSCASVDRFFPSCLPSSLILQLSREPVVEKPASGAATAVSPPVVGEDCASPAKPPRLSIGAATAVSPSVVKIPSVDDASPACFKAVVV